MKTKTVREFSAGGVVFSKLEEPLEFILIRRKIKANSERIWCLPKGKIEKGEDKEEAALREVQEETGVKARIIKQIDKINYWFYKDKKVRCYKTVYFYVMEKVTGEANSKSFEVEDVGWFYSDEALKKMGYQSEIDIVKKAMRIYQRLKS